MKKIGVVILNYNSTKYTIACLESLQNIDTADAEVLVTIVDNHSEEAEVNKLSHFLDTFHFSRKKMEFVCILNEKNLGFSGGNNIGIKNVLNWKADYVLILNNDTEVQKNFLLPMLATLEDKKRVGIAVPKIYFAPGYEFHKDRYTKKDEGRVIWYAGGTIDWQNLIGSHRGVDEVDQGQYNESCKTEFATGACFLIRASLLKKLGGFDERYFLYYEDSDLSMRVKTHGYSIQYVPQSYLWHKNAGSTGGSGSKLQDYFITRNRLLFGQRYAPVRTKVALVKESLKLLATGREWQKKGVLDFFLRNFGKGRYPVRE